MPDFNPIETVFAHVKSWYKRQRLTEFANGRVVDTKKLIEKAFKRIRSTTIEASIRRSLNLIHSISN